MPASAEIELLCEQCGAPLPRGSAGLGCLRCLLLGGFEAGGSSSSLARPADALAVPKVGQPAARLYQHYEICLGPDGRLRELGRGAMGVTYQALDVNLRVLVALKVIAAEFSAHPEARARFLHEARAAARLRHPNVASVFHYGTFRHAETSGEECFYAMEFVEGETLDARVRRDGPLPAPLALAIALEVARALAAAEQRGLVHRDLKPANVMLVAGGVERRDAGADVGEAWVKVIDFGLAKAIGETVAAATGNGDGAGHASLTALGEWRTHGAFLGTPGFASPEQFAGGVLDARADIFSLGVTLWYLLTGEMPFCGRTLADIYDRQVNHPPPAAQLTQCGVPTPVRALLAAMLAPAPERRPASALALCEALGNCLAALRGETSLRPPRAKRPAKRGGRQSALKAVAVLPLENLSDDKENAFFADGIQDDVLTSLAKIGELKVIPRSSVRDYPAGGRRDPRKIGRQLGITHYLEGSVRRVGERVLVNVSLIETRTGAQLWAERYDRTLTDALTLQGELAREIARELHATFSPAERARVAAQPTADPEAYVLYLRAREYQTRPSLLQQDNEIAAQLYEQAIARDPGFALAHARLAETLAYLSLDVQPTLENRTRARAAAETALRLQPDLGEGHRARGLCLYWIEKNYAGALAELALAARTLPHDPEIAMARGRIHRRQGRWREALGDFEEILAQDGRDATAARELAITATDLRDWPAAARAWDRTQALSPELVIFRGWRAYVDFWWRGALGSLRATAAAVPPNLDPDGAISFLRWDSAVLARDFAAAELAATHCALEPLPNPCMGPPLTRAYMLGNVALARGDTARAGELFESVRPGLEAEVAAHPGRATRHAALGLLYAYLGRVDEALRAGRHAVALMPESAHAYDGTVIASYLALIHARVGQPEPALDLLERLLTIAGPVNWYEASVTLADLRTRWQWDPLRAEPRFRALVGGREPGTVF